MVQVQESGVGEAVEGEQVESLMMTLEGLEDPKVLGAQKVHPVVHSNGIHRQQAVHSDRMHHPHQRRRLPEEY